jgi:hypothetical protein
VAEQRRRRRRASPAAGLYDSHLTGPVLIKASPPKLKQCLPETALPLHLVGCDQPEKKKLAHGWTRPVPPEPVAARAGWKAIRHTALATLIALDNVIHLPMSIQVRCPPSPFKLERVATEMAMATSPIKNLPPLPLGHLYASWSLAAYNRSMSYPPRLGRR